MATLQSLDIKRRSASTEPPPSARKHVEVAKLIDVSKCIGCKACQVACLEWNDLVEEVGVNGGVYDNPHDLTENTWTLMRYAEHVNGEGNLEWLIRKDGCMHCEDPGCLKACTAPGAIVQLWSSYRKTASAAAIASRDVLSTSRASRRPIVRPISARCAPTASR